MKIYEAAYCPCMYESTPCVLSLHRTREGAQKAIDEHKAQAIAYHDNLMATEEHPVEFWIGDRYWDIKEHELKD